MLLPLPYLLLHLQTQLQKQPVAIILHFVPSIDLLLFAAPENHTFWNSDVFQILYPQLLFSQQAAQIQSVFSGFPYKTEYWSYRIQSLFPALPASGLHDYSPLLPVSAEFSNCYTVLLNKPDFYILPLESVPHHLFAPDHLSSSRSPPEAISAHFLIPEYSLKFLQSMLDTEFPDWRHLFLKYT